MERMTRTRLERAVDLLNKRMATVAGMPPGNSYEVSYLLGRARLKQSTPDGGSRDVSLRTTTREVYNYVQGMISALDEVDRVRKIGVLHY